MKLKFCISLLYVFVLAGLFTSCIKQKCTRDILFEGQVNIYPKLDTFYVGDTFEIEVFFEQPLVDLNSGEAFYVDSIDYLTSLNFGRIDLNPGEFAALLFEPYIVNGEIFYRQLAPPISDIGGEPFNYIIQYEAGYFKCKFKILQAGNYYMYVMSELDNYHIADLTDQCKDYLKIQFKMLNGDAGENNYPLLKLSPYPTYNQISEENFLIYGTYAFVVKE